MANITKQERERRAAEAALKTSNPAEEITTNPGHVPPVVEIANEEGEAVIQESPPPEKTVFSPSENDLRQLHAIALEKEKQVSRDAINQAIKDACAIATAKVNNDPVTQALNADLGDKGKRQAFLQKFGPSNMKPPCPKPGPMGIKDEAVMRWKAMYEPEEFKAIYAHSRAPLVIELLKTIS